MKNVIVFDVENVLFNVNYVKGCLRRRDEKMGEMDEFKRSYGERSREKYLDESYKKVRLYKKIKDSVKDLMEIRGRFGGKIKLYVISEFKNEWVWKLMKLNGISVDGIYSNIEKCNEEVGFEGKDVVYLSGLKERVEEGKKIGVNSVLCKWGNKNVRKEEGIENGEDLLRSVGIIKVDNEKKEEGVDLENNGNEVEEKSESNSEIVFEEKVVIEVEEKESGINWDI